MQEDEEDEEEEEEEDETPSCIESLASSCEQLHKLARELTQVHVRLVILWPLLATKHSDCNTTTTTTQQQFATRDERDKLALTVELLAPILHSTSSHVDKCLATLEATLRRCAFYINRAADAAGAQAERGASAVSHASFELTPSVCVASVFFAIIELLHALASLDTAIQSSGGDARQRLADLRKAVAIEQQQQPTATKLEALDELLASVELTLFNKSLFEQALEHVQHLGLSVRLDDAHKRALANKSNRRKLSKKDAARWTHRTLREHMQTFIVWYSEQFVAKAIAKQDGNGNSNSSDKPQDMCVWAAAARSAAGDVFSVANRAFGLVALYALYARLFAHNPLDKSMRHAMASTLVACGERGLHIVHTQTAFAPIMLHELLAGLDDDDGDDDNDELRAALTLLRQQHFETALVQANVRADVERNTLDTFGWLARFGGATSGEQLLELAHEGLRLAERANTHARRAMAAHKRVGKPMSKLKLALLVRLVGQVKAVEAALVGARVRLVDARAAARRAARQECAQVMSRARKRLLGASTSLVPAHLLQLTRLCERTACARTCGERATLVLALSMLAPALDAQEATRLCNALLAHHDDHLMQRQLEAVASGAHLFWMANATQVYYAHVLANSPKSALDEIRYLHRSLDDIEKLLAFDRTIGATQLEAPLVARLREARDAYLTRLAAEFVDEFRVECGERVCQALEVELRLQTHSELIANDDAHEHESLTHDLHAACRRPFVVLGRAQVSLRDMLEQHLSRTCYNLSAMAPRDARAYDSMANLARHKHALRVARPLLLPDLAGDEQLDVLDIARNLPAFVARYSYDMAHQLFVEKVGASMQRTSGGGGQWHTPPASVYAESLAPSSAATRAPTHLYVLHAHHVARSMRVHGLALSHLCTNSSYACAKRLVRLLARQLASNDELRAALEREQAHIRAPDSSKLHIASTLFERAQSLARRHQPQLDSARQLITHLGNTLAFVRLMRSGALACAADACAFVGHAAAQLEPLVHAELGCGGGGNSSPLRKAAAHFDQALRDAVEPQQDHLASIVRVFCNALQLNEANLNTLHALAPPLTINFVDYVINCEERAASRSAAARLGALVSDDGFALGLAFLLVVLPSQRDQFANLNWFAEVRARLAAERTKARESLASGDSLKQTASLTVRRVARLEAEYAALDHCLNSALLVFRCGDSNSDNSASQ